MEAEIKYPGWKCSSPTGYYTHGDTCPFRPPPGRRLPVDDGSKDNADEVRCVAEEKDISWRYPESGRVVEDEWVEPPTVEGCSPETEGIDCGPGQECGE